MMKTQYFRYLTPSGMWSAFGILLRRFHQRLWRMLNKWRFAELGENCTVRKAIELTPRCIFLKPGVSIFKNCRVQGVFQYGNKTFDPKIIFDQGSSAQQNLHLTCANQIYIGKNTALAANVTITDIDHPYEDINLPVERQDIRVDPVSIGDDCKIYNNAVILPGTRIGKHCVIGANSVVKGEFPDYCVLAGVPARVVKRYDPGTRTWVKPPRAQAADTSESKVQG